ncbi:hypothetical protein MTO96_030618 [Rhipicephalus appendiculatus]
MRRGTEAIFRAYDHLDVTHRQIRFLDSHVESSHVSGGPSYIRFYIGLLVNCLRSWFSAPDERIAFLMFGAHLEPSLLFIDLCRLYFFTFNLNDFHFGRR